MKLNNKLLRMILFMGIISLAFYNCKQKKTDITPIAPQEVVTPDALIKVKAKITGERKEVEIGNKFMDAWSIIYKDKNGNLKSTIIKKETLATYQKGDSIIIYYDSSNPIALPISEKQYINIILAK